MTTSREIRGGYAGRVLRVDLDRGTTSTEALDPDLARQYIGGRGFNVRRLFDEVAAGTDGLSPDNKLIFGVGPLTGTLFPGSRFNVSAMSPQTGILGDSNAGGFFGPELKFAGYDQVIIEGRSREPVYLYINNDASSDRVELRPAGHLWGKDVWETTEAVLEELGDSRFQVATIGQGAENGVRFAGIFSNLVRPCARTGMGTVMAGKNLKAVAVRGRRPVKIADPVRYRELMAKMDSAIRDHDEYEIRVRLGTTKLVTALNDLGALATRHFQTGRFEAASRVSGERLEELYKLKSKGCGGCTIPCSRYFRITDGPYEGLASEGPEFEGLAGFASRVGNDDLAASLKAVDLCNRYGLDVISTSEVISFVMELHQRGLIIRDDAGGLDLSWGNVETIHTLIREIAYREGFGDILADGVREAARRLGPETEDLAIHVKGLELFQADPRGIKAYALGNAVASRGGDHLRSEPWFEFSEDAAEGLRRFGAAESAFRLEHKGKGRVVKYFEEIAALSDCVEVCKNTVVNMEVLPFDVAAEMLEAVVGWDMGAEELHAVCERVVNLERLFIAREGITRKDDTLPRRFLEEPLPPDSGPSAGSVVRIEGMLDEYYEARGWSQETGLPTDETLERLGLAGDRDDGK